MINYAELEAKILAFWNWFANNERQFREIEDATVAIEALDNQILTFGMFSWEIGEGEEKPHYLAISPNGDKKQLQISKMMVQLAPNLIHWEWYYNKKPFEWDLQIEMYDSFLMLQKFDAAEWEYSIMEKSNGRIDIYIYAENIQQLDSEDQSIGAETAVIRIIGEENRIIHVDEIKVVTDFEPEQENRVYLLDDLNAEFGDLFEGF